MKKKPLVSIVIPCYNNATTIEDTITSILNQTYQNIEIVIVNDGSEDNSLETIYQLSKDLNNFKIIDQINSGPSKSRNNGALQATGEFLVFVDADDKIHSNYIEEAVDKLSSDSKIELVYAGAEFFGSKTGIWSLPDFTTENFLENNCIPIFAVMRLDTFKKAGMFDTHLHYLEDWELWIRIIFNFGGTYKIPQTRYYYRKREEKNSLTDLNKIDNVQDTSRLYVYNKHYELFKQNKYDITTLLTEKRANAKYKQKYYNVWYRKLFYFLKKKNS